jgi:hypothetical protein
MVENILFDGSRMGPSSGGNCGASQEVFADGLFIHARHTMRHAKSRSYTLGKSPCLF